jgi:hypothetical protein
VRAPLERSQDVEPAARPAERAEPGPARVRDPVLREALSFASRLARRAEASRVSPADPAGAAALRPDGLALEHLERPPEIRAGALPRHDALAAAIAARARSLPGGAGTVELRFALSPPELGTVRVRIEARGEHLRVRLVAGSQAAADVLAPGLARLTAHLNVAGYPDADVSLALDTSADPGAFAGGRHAESRNPSNASPAAARATSAQPSEPPLAARAARGRLDRTA